MSNNKASSVLLARIAGAALREFNRDDLYVAQTPPGMALGEAHLELLEQLELDRFDDPSSVARLVELSQIVDCIQDSQKAIKTPAQDPTYLSDMFPQVVNNVEFLAAPLNEADRRRYERAKSILYEDHPFIKTSAYQEFCILNSDLEKKEAMLVEMKQNLQQTNDSEEKAVLQSEYDDLAQVHHERKDELDALDQVHGFRTAKSIVDKAEQRIDEVPASVKKALDTIEIFQIANPINNVPHVACSFFPSHLSEDNWVPLKLTREDIAAGNAETGDPDDFDNSEIETIELEIQTLVCERPWLWSALFTNRHWNWRTPSQPISTGDMATGDAGLIQGYIHGLIFARNLMVKFKPSARPQVHLSTAPTKPSASFLMHAITPLKLTPQKAVAKLSPGMVKRTAVRPSPLILRSAVSNTVVRAQPVGPAVVSKPKVALRAAPAVVLPATAFVKKPIAAGSLVLRPGIFSKLAAKGRVVDQRGQGVYQAIVTLNTTNGLRRTTTGKDGTFLFSSMDRGRFALSVSKAGFVVAKGALTVPQTAQLTIHMRQTDSCFLQVNLMEQVDGRPRPFTGDAKVLIQSGNKRRLESMGKRTKAVFALPPGNIMVSVTSPEADHISPERARINLQPGHGVRQTVTFMVQRALTISNPETQVLGFVCRRIPRSPDPENVH